MKGSEQFKEAIAEGLRLRAFKDPQLAELLKKENKTIDGCVNYILRTVKNSGVSGCSDDEVFGMAIHYYTEDSVKGGKTVGGNVVVNHQVKLSKEEVEKLKKKAREEVIAEEKAKMRKKKPKVKKDDKAKKDNSTLF